MAVDGGRSASFGFRYQYLATAEELLRVFARTAATSSISPCSSS
jgi:hypothetical protein